MTRAEIKMQLPAAMEGGFVKATVCRPSRLFFRKTTVFPFFHRMPGKAKKIPPE